MVLFLLLLPLPLLPACSPDDSGPSGPGVEPAVASVSVSPGDTTLTYFGEAVALSATARDASGEVLTGRTVFWSSSNSSAVSVDASGRATAIANGEAIVRAIVEGVAGEATVAVAPTGAALAVIAGPEGGSAGEAFTSQPVVEVRDAGGVRVDGDSTTVVTASIESGGGELLGSVAATVDGGVAAFTELAIGGAVGERTLRFSAPDLQHAVSAPFELGPGSAAAVALGSGDAQTGLADTELAEPLVVSVVDGWGNGVPGVAIGWRTTEGGGRASPRSTRTDAEGRASVGYALGRHPGDGRVEAVAPGLDGSPVAFTVTATPNGTIRGAVSATTTRPMAFGAAPESAVSSSGPPGPGLVRPTTRAAYEPRLSGRDGGVERARRDRSSRYAATGPEYVPDELIVTLRPEAVQALGHRALARAAAGEVSRVADRLRSELEGVRRAAVGVDGRPAFRVAGVSPVTLSARLKLDEPGELDAVADRLRADGRIAAVERNRIIRRPARAAPSATDPPVDDELYPWQAWHYGMIDLPAAWRLTTGGADVVVAVIDDGIRFDHTDLAGNLTDDGYDFVSNDRTYSICSVGVIGRAGDGDGYDADPTIPLAAGAGGFTGCAGPRDVGGHGLHVAGTIGATTGDGAGGVGVSRVVSIRPVRVLDVTGRGTHYEIAQGVLYAAGLAADDGTGGTVRPASGAEVINLSLGGAHGTALRNAVQSAASAGALIVAAAGNRASSIAVFPAAYPEVVSVSAVDPHGDLASYSSYGHTIELAAPGGEMGLGRDFGVVSAAWNFTDATSDWIALQGTSMAAPHVSGVAALIFAAEPGISAAAVRRRLREWAVDMPPAGRDGSYGYGIVNARNSLTRSFEPDGDLRVRLIEAGSGRIVDEVEAASGGAYEFTEVDDGDYFIFAGKDRNGDGFIGIPGRRWDGYGGATAPAVVTVDGAGEYGASFTIGHPLEAEPNDDFDGANELPLNGYIRGVISEGAPLDADLFLVRVPEAGSYVFETSGVRGMCGFVREEDTVLQLYDAERSLVAENDDVDLDRDLLCSRITAALDAGTYYVAVRGHGGGGRYRLHAREASR